MIRVISVGSNSGDRQAKTALTSPPRRKIQFPVQRWKLNSYRIYAVCAHAHTAPPVRVSVSRRNLTMLLLYSSIRTSAKQLWTDTG